MNLFDATRKSDDKPHRCGMERRLLRFTLHVIGLISFGSAIFYAALFAMFFVLYSIYGDSQGGRWAHCSWPVAVAAMVAVVTLYLRYVLGHRVIVVLLALFEGTIGWIAFAVIVLMPPL